jgi:hypothetical protein
MQHILEASPYKVDTILTDLPTISPPVRANVGDGNQFAELHRNHNAIYSRPMRFDMICKGMESSTDLPSRTTRGPTVRQSA